MSRPRERARIGLGRRTRAEAEASLRLGPAQRLPVGVPPACSRIRLQDETASQVPEELSGRQFKPRRLDPLDGPQGSQGVDQVPRGPRPGAAQREMTACLG